VSEPASPGDGAGERTGTYRLVVLASGNGSNLQAIIDTLHGRVAAPDGRRIEVVSVISDQTGARALERAEMAGIPTHAFDLRDAGSRDAQEAAILAAVRSLDPDLVVLAGYMRIIPSDFVQAFPWRIINLHPALLPAFPGTTSIKDALEHGCKVTGVTVHFVDEGLDTGPIIAQQEVRIEEDDTVESLAARIHEVEHRLLPQTICLLATGRVTPPLPGTRVVRVDFKQNG